MLLFTARSLACLTACSLAAHLLSLARSPARPPALPLTRLVQNDTVVLLSQDDTSMLDAGSGKGSLKAQR